MKKILVILSILVVFIIILTALEQTDELDDYEISKSGKELIFTNLETKKVIKTINLETDNPFISRYGIKSDEGYSYYILNNKINSYKDYPVSDKISTLFADNEKNNTPIRMTSNIIFRISCNKQYACVSYGLGMGGFEDVEPIYNTVLFKVYDAEGTLLNEIEIFDRAGWDFEISENGDFIGCKFRKVDEDLTTHRGYMAIEVSTGNIVTEDLPPEDTYYTVGNCAKHQHFNQMYFSIRRKGYFISFTYDFDNSSSYVLRYKAQDMGLRERLKDGYKMYMSRSDSIEFIPFTDFETHKWLVK